MFEKYLDVLTLDEFAEIMRTGRRSAVKILKSSGIPYRILRGAYKIPKQAVIDYFMDGEN